MGASDFVLIFMVIVLIGLLAVVVWQGYNYQRLQAEMLHYTAQCNKQLNQTAARVASLATDLEARGLASAGDPGAKAPAVDAAALEQAVHQARASFEGAMAEMLEAMRERLEAMPVAVAANNHHAPELQSAPVAADEPAPVEAPAAVEPIVPAVHKASTNGSHAKDAGPEPLSYLEQQESQGVTVDYRFFNGWDVIGWQGSWSDSSRSRVVLATNSILDDLRGPNRRRVLLDLSGLDDLTNAAAAAAQEVFGHGSDNGQMMRVVSGSPERSAVVRAAFDAEQAFLIHSAAQEALAAV